MRAARRPRPGDGPAYQRYDATAQAAAELVIGRYSTSFGLATRLLETPVRGDVRAIYALVRVADEIVDAPRPDVTVDDQRAVLDHLESEVGSAIERGLSSDLVVHAFARTARRCGIRMDLVEPFFASMRTDLTRTTHDPASFATYVHGSAEVVGLMCLRAFLTEEVDPEQAYARLRPGAQRLGAAFQKVNFLRDIAADREDLGRGYFPGVDPRAVDDAERDRILDDVDADLAAAAVAIAQLPRSSRRAVEVAHRLFAELSARLRRTPADQLRSERIRVPGPRKAAVVLDTLVRGAR
ncbi:squalene/phytoene synthase family protein [Marihabitans asiaticum]|uniref:Phytoene/squalene synthetase n=1 Tax=Marihabitans asiaticum TaxID=415218 RepID=A0A560WA60_9MICO|nr:squalene/phytoene synthase family protein [Marihabitans asiaticum]TWD14519.1 phytoene/squalene synthetase [Marihabitans asiaticum]